eukprot:COSAG04_NODE_3315_length_2942_cov_1.361942_1_plen_283_part_00
MCSAPVTIIETSWRSISAGGGTHCDTSEDGGDDIDGFGGGASRTVHFNLLSGENSLAMHRPGRGGHCGTDTGGWLSGWAGPHVTGSWSADDGGPPREYEVSARVDQFPPAGGGRDATVCFDDGVGPCDYHMAIRVANCGDHLRFELPPVPYCNSGPGLAYCVGPVPPGVLPTEPDPRGVCFTESGVSGAECSGRGQRVDGVCVCDDVLICRDVLGDERDPATGEQLCSNGGCRPSSGGSELCIRFTGSNCDVEAPECCSHWCGIGSQLPCDVGNPGNCDPSC